MSSKIVVSKIEVLKSKDFGNWHIQTKTNNFAFEINAEIRLESSFYLSESWSTIENSSLQNFEPFKIGVYKNYVFTTYSV